MTQIIIAIVIFLLFFGAVGMVQLLGYRNMMCSCKAYRYVQSRQKGIRDAQQAQESPELITKIETMDNSKDEASSND